MEPITQLFIILLISGILLITIEFFVPGGVLGTLGTIALLGAIVIAFNAFGSKNGFIVAVLILLFTSAFIMAWLNFFPKTTFGKAITLSRNGASFKADDEADKELQGLHGTSITDLHPAGIAEIDGRRVDVVADGCFIDKGCAVQVLTVQGNHITVCEVET